MADLTARAAVEYLKRCHTPTYDLQLTTYNLQLTTYNKSMSKDKILIRVKKRMPRSAGRVELSIDLEMAADELVAITGQSGSGKSTLLRIISGLERPDEGVIHFRGTVWLDTAARINLPPQRRAAALVFQDYALFPHWTVRQNINFALGRQQNDTVVDELLEATGLTNLAGRYPPLLSGGEAQRVALARGLAQHPDFLLLDEPLAALDPETRSSLQAYVVNYCRQSGKAALLISHDFQEIAKMAGRAYVMRNGQLHPANLPDQGRRNPANLLCAEVVEYRRRDDPKLVCRLGNNLLELTVDPAVPQVYGPGDLVWLDPGQLRIVN